MTKPLLMTLLLLGVGLAPAAHAQNARVTAGVVAFTSGDYGRALSDLDAALADPSLLTPENVPKAYYYRAKARMARVVELAGAIQRAGAGDPHAQEELENAAKELIPRTWNDYRRAREHEHAGRWKELVAAELPQLYQQALQTATGVLHHASQPTLSREDKRAAYAEALGVLDVAIQIAPDEYLPYSLRAEAKRSLDGETDAPDTRNAHADFATAARLFGEHPPAHPDLLIAYVYYRKALIERYPHQDADAALATLAAGRKALDGEMARLRAMKDRYDRVEWGQLTQQYEDVSADLQRFELDTLFNAPGQLARALQRFEQAASANPKDYMIRVAWASLLEQAGQLDKADAVYRAATELDPSRAHAWTNLGVLRVNRAVALTQQAHAADDEGRTQALLKEAHGRLEAALPALRKAQELERCNGTALRALRSVTLALELDDEYRKYEEAETECLRATD